MTAQTATLRSFPRSQIQNMPVAPCAFLAACPPSHPGHAFPSACLAPPRAHRLPDAEGMRRALAASGDARRDDTRPRVSGARCGALAALEIAFTPGASPGIVWGGTPTPATERN